MGDDAQVPEAGIFYNRVTGTAHMTHATDSSKSACGIFMNPICFQHSTDDYALLGCTLCWRSGCANWTASVSFSENEEADDVASPTDTGGYAFPDGVADDELSRLCV